MPYVGHPARSAFEKWLSSMTTVFNEGELNYIITKILLRTKPQNYRDYSSLKGQLHHYEDAKIAENGDVY